MTIIQITLGKSKKESPSSPVFPSKSREPSQQPLSTGTKLVIRLLPPHLPSPVFVDSLSPYLTANKEQLHEPSPDQKNTNEDNIKTTEENSQSTQDKVTLSMPWSDVDWWVFVPGKPASRPAKLPVYSRAYLHFKDLSKAQMFAQAFHGHVYKDKSGQDYPVWVEKAPYQRIPKEVTKRDPRINTIEEDPVYKAFLDRLNTSPSEPNAAEPLSNVSDDIALTNIGDFNPLDTSTTALLNSLRAKQKAKAAKKATNKVKGKNGKGLFEPSAKGEKSSRSKEEKSSSKKSRKRRKGKDKVNESKKTDASGGSLVVSLTRNVSELKVNSQQNLSKASSSVGGSTRSLTSQASPKQLPSKKPKNSKNAKDGRKRNGEKEKKPQEPLKMTILRKTDS